MRARTQMSVYSRRTALAARPLSRWARTALPGRHAAMKQEAPQQRRSRTGTPAIHGGEHVKSIERRFRSDGCRRGVRRDVGSQRRNDAEYFRDCR
jgi:hypothetical protein